ncbi:AAA family ATPase [Paenisporosarcina quisquiliarum]|uniref:Nuclease SbcCD subunit C n=1 Tax=Paenisporosarcina quisquiliarum TaxID=365346 RepID=A0A9X3LHK5_9BACL|nr:AAA family ATPase [Paenisporosarcina quisquiliarum]MCZ8537867.1 AAA family ATPase [Paenisporosarcina quisquiliarum]
MKPITLKMTAFGPYKQTETIDFTELQGNQLFVISGSTGAGKTTIFDGICFALYGAASGSDRSESRIMRSDFADDAVHTAVELVFEIHQKTYRILRQMSHVKKGNKSATGEKYEFFEKFGDREVPVVERQIVSEINVKVEEILGLTQNQFIQIVMLPQGEFRKLLTSETENKEDILRKIFKTEPYKMISERLKQKKTHAEEELKIAQRTRNSYIHNIVSSLPARESTIFNVLAQEHFNMHQVISGLEEEATYYENKIVLDQIKYNDAYQKHTSKSGEFHQAKSLNERFEEWGTKKQKLQVLTEQLPLFEEKETRLEKAERASVIEAIEQQYVELQKEVLEKQQLLNDAIASEEKAKIHLEQMNLKYVEEEKKQDEREKLSESLVRYHDILPVVRDMAVKENELKELKVKITGLSVNVKKLAERTVIENEKLQSLKLETESLDNQLGSFDDKLQKLSEINDQCRVLKEYNAVQQAVYNQEAVTLKRQQEFTTVRDAYSALEQEWFDNQARVLAAHLHDGEACPVCGSVEHPQKNDKDQTLSPSKEELEQSKYILNQVDNDYRDALAKLKAYKNQCDDKGQELSKFGIEIGQAVEAHKSMDEMRLKLDEEVSDMRKDKEKLRLKKQQLKDQTVKVEQLQAQTSDITATYQELNSTFEKSKAVYEDKLQSIPSEVRVLSQLEKQIRETEERKRRLEEAWTAVQQERQKAKDQYATTVLTIDHMEKAVLEAKAKEERAGQSFSTALTSSSFESAEAYQQAKLQASEKASLKEEITHFKQTRHTLDQQVTELSALLQGKTKVDLAALQNDMIALKQVYELALQEMNQSVETQKAASKLIENIKVSNEKSALKEQEFNRITDLYDVVRGQNGMKISFERYLQIEYLEQIIESANERLKHLSNGQFHLIRSERQESRGKQSGLGLDVYDAYTGQTRDVKTLSGGEKFNASLCLALGMADVIQSFQGNVSIDTMFIDEGFGSLDEESLNKSIDTLIDLQKSGRMIGVISHVQELKTAIPAILEVRKSKEGYSETRFVIK